MEPKSVSFSSLILASCFSLLVLLGISIYYFFTDSPKLVFCDVGQGDGAYIRTSSHMDIVIDAGPQSMSSCLTKYMPLYDSTIELAFVSHPQLDHFGGFTDLIKHYHINTMVLFPVTNTKEFSLLVDELRSKGTYLTSMYSGDVFRLGNSTIISYWPSRDFMTSHTITGEGRYQLIGDSNNISQVLLFNDGAMRSLFTGDLSPASSIRVSGITNVPILKIPHHGSKNGLTQSFLARVMPQIGVISVGYRNQFGHPNKIILDLLASFHVQVKRTDRDGDIVIYYDQNHYWF